MIGEIRVIPGYENYGVNEVGMVVSLQTQQVLQCYILNGYLIVNTFRGSLTETLPVHRAVALAWVHNPDPTIFNIVNHKDGETMNNYWQNLEWTNYSGNNYHAVEHGLRNDNIPCKVRDFCTGNVTFFPSIAQACVFMGLPKDTEISRLQPKMFGKLIQEQYEFRFDSDQTPWFYENRTELIPPSRYMVQVRKDDGSVEEVYSNREMLRRFQLYDSPSKSIPGLAEYGNQKFPDLEFVVRDGYSESQFREERKTRKSEQMQINAHFGEQILRFDSLTQAANYFNVDRSSIQNRLGTSKSINGWTFILASLDSNV